MKADSGGGGGDGHGAGDSGSDGVLVLPPPPPLPDGRADLWTQGNTSELRLRTPLSSLHPLGCYRRLPGVVTGSIVGGDIHIITSIGLLFGEPVCPNEEGTPFPPQSNRGAILPLPYRIPTPV